MISVQFDYAAPDSLETAVKLLAETNNSQILAKSHSLIAALQAGEISPALLIDVGKIAGLQGIQTQADGSLQINALTTYAQIATDARIKDNYPVLAEVAASIGDAQIRNWQAIGDTFAYRDLASDLLAVALTLDASFSLVSQTGIRTVTTENLISELVQANWQLPGIITAINFPASPANTGTAYQNFKNPANYSTLCGIVALVERSPSSNTVTKCRIAVAGATPYALRFTEGENYLQGKTPSAENLTELAQLAQKSITDINSDRYASADYRKHLIGVLTHRSLLLATQKAGFVL